MNTEKPRIAVRGAERATRLITLVTGRTTPQLSSARQGLFDKALVEAAGDGRPKFTMSGFAEFVRTRTDTPWDGPSGAAPRAALPPTIHRELPPGDPPQLPRGR